MIPDNILPQILSYQEQAPVRVTEIAKDFGLEIYQDNLPKGVSGKLLKNPEFKTKSGFGIIVNNKEPFVRQRFTAAHELGHFVHHRNMIGDGIEENYMLRAKGVSSEQETEANQFAADLLMPFCLIEKLVKEGIRELDALAEKLEVSKIAMAIRLGYPT